MYMTPYAGMNAGGRGVGGGGGRGGPPVGADKWARGLAIPGSAPAGARGTLLHKTDQRYEVRSGSRVRSGE